MKDEIHFSKARLWLSLNVRSHLRKEVMELAHAVCFWKSWLCAVAPVHRPCFKQWNELTKLSERRREVAR